MKKRIGIFLLLCPVLAIAQTVTLSPIAKQQFFGTTGSYYGKPLAGGKVYTYVAGTNTPQVTYTDATGKTPNTNPILLDSAGLASIWIIPGYAYRYVVQDVNGVQQWTQDNVQSSTGGVPGVDYVSYQTIRDVLNSHVQFNKFANDATLRQIKIGGSSSPLHCTNYPVLTFTRVSDSANIVAPVTLTSGMSSSSPLVLTNLLITSMAAGDQVKVTVTGAGSLCTPDGPWPIYLQWTPITTQLQPAQPDSLGGVFGGDCSSVGTGYVLQGFNADGSQLCTAAPVPSVGTPSSGMAACIKGAGPPVLIGYCSSVVASDGSCTCN